MTALSISASMMHPPDKDVITFAFQESTKKKNNGKKKGEELLNSEKNYIRA